MEDKIVHPVTWQNAVLEQYEKDLANAKEGKANPPKADPWFNPVDSVCDSLVYAGFYASPANNELLEVTSLLFAAREKNAETVVALKCVDERLCLVAGIWDKCADTRKTIGKDLLELRGTIQEAAELIDWAVETFELGDKNE